MGKVVQEAVRTAGKPSKVNDKDGNPYGLTQFGPRDVVTMDAAGGGGYGDPLERELALVERDVADGYVSIERAQADYGAVIDPGTMKVDQEASKKLRASKAQSA